MSATMDCPRKWRLGVPYQGSKNQIAREIISILPRGERFVDLFAGGCAMTHAAMLSGKYDTFLANDLHGFGVRLFINAIDGKCNGRWRDWISRDEFYAKRDIDPMIALCWSFGNNQSEYIYGKTVEPIKRKLLEKVLNGQHVSGGLQHKESAESLERLEVLKQINANERLQHSERDYSQYEFQDGDVVYRDIPYRSATESYRFMRRRGMSFDFDRFYEWVQTREFPVFVSEYEMPKGFTEIWSKRKLGIFNKTKCNEYKAHVERAYVADRYADKFMSDLFFGIDLQGDFR